MEALLSALLAAALAELGDKTQWLALALALRFRDQGGAVLAGIALAAIVNAAIASAAGIAVSAMLTREATTLMLAFALVSAGVTMMLKARPAPGLEGWRIGAFLTSFAAFGIAELGDKTQFLTFAIATRTGMPVLTAAGTAAGVFVMSALAVAGGRTALDALPLGVLRRVGAALFLLLGAIAAVNALQLV
jgi:putative Ca2+/H+ antiporter (TMEM165/GDT1 family)